MFTTDSGPTCYDWAGCPKCDCDGRNAGEIWYVEYQSIWDLSSNEAKCARCECETDQYGNNYAQCENNYDDYIIGSKSCPPEEEDPWECHEAGSVTSGTFLFLCFN